MKTLLKSRKRITAAQVAEILGLAKKTIYNGGAGTDKLTRVQIGPGQVRFLLWEVLALAERQEKEAKGKLR